ncbi:MAG TPA: hypothetical protein C5S51_01250 [Methanosarcinaceae archaeon]|nr:hypothetical protein [Methanosarcinaceae archaeon]
MMQILFDTDILSTFAKAYAIQHLEALFSNDHLLITPEVYSELKVPKEYGYDFPDQIFNSNRFDLVQLTDKEIDEFKSNLLDIKSIHSGELETITIAMNRGYIFCSKDVKALYYAVAHGVEVLYFHTILKAFWKFEILAQEKVESLMDTMEQVDNMTIKNRDIIFES